jgi:hypothetical protein
MIKKMFAVGVATAFAMSLLTPVMVSAKGFGPHALHKTGAHGTGHSVFAKSLGYRGHRALRYDRFYNPFGGYLAGYGIPGSYLEDFEPILAGFPPLRIDPIIPPPPPLTCSRSRETVTVPAESGGTRQITITRC